MRCSACGAEGHNNRTCPYKDKDIPRDYAVWVKADNLTEREANKLSARLINIKDKIAPYGRATLVKGNIKNLPKRIQEALRLPE